MKTCFECGEEFEENGEVRCSDCIIDLEEKSE
jgi:hypothetical protein